MDFPPLERPAVRYCYAMQCHWILDRFPPDTILLDHVIQFARNIFLFCRWAYPFFAVCQRCILWIGHSNLISYRLLLQPWMSNAVHV